ncbi:MAG: Pr6Pr family membrane protein [Defluviitaleaceae bacterium]|nr:Pr6Pr family membrane protein [Defluviitaleaceae bacterium]MCL2835992.1 Pr6Pr family membrane protein [Defluviitaleaceae bacterium]
MYIKNRGLALVFRLAALSGCGYGMAAMSNIFGGGFQTGMLIYYTNLSNIAVFAYLLASAAHTACGIARHGVYGQSTLLPGLKRALIMMITVTMLVYHFVLAPLLFTMDVSLNYAVHGLTDILVHYFTPLMLIADWLLFDEKERVRWFEPLQWLILPFAYLVFIMIRAEVGAPLNSAGLRYPYFFLDLDIYGPFSVMGHVTLCMLAFSAVGYVFFALDKLPRGFARIYSFSAQTRDIDV